MHRTRFTPGLDIVPSHLAEYGTRQESNGLVMLRYAVITAAFWIVLCLLSLPFSSCKPAQVARVKQPKGPLLGIRDVEQPAPKHGYFYNDSQPTH